MSNYAIIKTGGKQVKVEEGQVIYVEKLNVEAGQTVTFDEVVLVGGATTKVGAHSFLCATVMVKLKNMVNKRKLLLSNINLKNTHTVNKVTVNLTLRLLSNQSTLKA